jgi:hypothetical protein
LAGTGLELSHDCTCILRDSVQKVYSNLNQVLQLDLGLYDLACDCMRRIRDKNRIDGLYGGKTAGFTIKVQTLPPREKSCPLVKGWEVGCLLQLFSPCESPHAHHGAACSKCGIPVLGRGTLASVPHHNQVLQLDLGLYDLTCGCMRRIHDKNRSDSLCDAKTAGFTIKVQTLLPREKSCPLTRMITDLGSLE